MNITGYVNEKKKQFLKLHSSQFNRKEYRLRMRMKRYEHQQMKNLKYSNLNIDAFIFMIII